MKTLLIHGHDAELTSARVDHLSQDNCVVLASTDSLEAAEIATMLKIGSVIISANNPAAYMVPGNGRVHHDGIGRHLRHGERHGEKILPEN